MVAEDLPVNWGFVTYHHQQRLDRARYHLDSLKEEVVAWLEEDPHRTWTVTEAEDDVPKKIVYCQVLRKPPSHLRLIVGDCVHNLRSALDNLAFELALAHKRGALSKGIQKDSAFPILQQDIEENEKSMERFKTATRGMCSDAKTVIEQLQPYKRGKDYAHHPLWRLNELSNQDKHRLPPVASAVTLGPVAYFVPEGIEAADVKPLYTAFEDRAAILSYPAFDKDGAEVNIDCLPDFSVGFSNLVSKELLGQDIPELLKVIHWYINNKVVPPLKPYLEKIGE